jgi:hypothetical protein
MSATLQQIHNAVVGAPLLRQRFAAARLKAAWDVLNESAGTTNHAARLAWANKVIASYEADLDPEFRRFLSNATIQTSGNNASDNDVQFVVNSFLNTFAGV